MTVKSILFTLGLLYITHTLAAIPSYIHVCKRNDPKLSQCIRHSIEDLKPTLRKGIPDLDIPPLEPLKLDDLVVQYGGNTLKIVGTDFVVTSASNFEIEELKADLPNHSFAVKLRFPQMIVDAIFEVTGKFLNVNLHGKGPVQVQADDIDGKAIIKGKSVTKGGQEYFVLDGFELKLNLKNYEVKLSNGFFKDPAVTDAINAALHENKRDIINVVRPRVEETVKDVLLKISNKITTHFTYDELFPAK